MRHRLFSQESSTLDRQDDPFPIQIHELTYEQQNGQFQINPALIDLQS
jgi:hypothetical protein